MRHWKIVGAIAALLVEGGLQLSGYQNLNLAVALFLVMAVLLLWSAWPTIKRIRFQKPIRLDSLDQPPTGDSKKAKMAWLVQVLEEDRNQLAGRVYLDADRWLFKGIDKTEPFFEVIIKVINAAVFPIAITGVKGFLQIQGTLCNTPTILSGGTRLLHGQNGNMRIRQPITVATAEALKALRASGTKAEFRFGSFSFAILPEEPNRAMEPTYVTIDRIYQIPISNE